MNDSSQSLLIGKKVKFSKNREENLFGTVLDKVSMLSKPDSNLALTGYMIVTDDNVIHSNIASWRILELITD